MFHQFSLDHSSWAHLSTASNWIGVQTSVHGFDSRTPHKPVVSKTSEADIWLSIFDHLTDVGGQRGGCKQLSQRKGVSGLTDTREQWVSCFLSVCTRASFHYIRRIPALRPKKPIGSWNLVNPLLSMNEAWMDECATRLQPLVDQYKTQTTPNFRNRKNSEIWS